MVRVCVALRTAKKNVLRKISRKEVVTRNNKQNSCTTHAKMDRSLKTRVVICHARSCTMIDIRLTLHTCDTRKSQLHQYHICMVDIRPISKKAILLSVNAHLVILRATNRYRCLVAFVPECIFTVRHLLKFRRTTKR